MAGGCHTSQLTVGRYISSISRYRSGNLQVHVQTKPCTNHENRYTHGLEFLLLGKVPGLTCHKGRNGDSCESPLLCELHCRQAGAWWQAAATHLSTATAPGKEPSTVQLQLSPDLELLCQGRQQYMLQVAHWRCHGCICAPPQLQPPIKRWT